MGKVLYLTYDGLTDFLGKSQVLPYLIGLVKSGSDITLISFEKKSAFKAHSHKVSAACKKHGIRWYPLKYTKYPPVISTIIDLINLKTLVLKLHRQSPFAIIHCRSYITSLVGLWAKRKLNTRFIFDMRGFWADERIDGKLWDLRNPVFNLIYKFFKKKEKRFFTESDYIISLTHSAKDEIIKLSNQSPVAPIEIIPCCVDLNLFDYRKITTEMIASKKQELNIPEGVTVLSYIGSISAWYMIREMLLFFKQWLKQEPDAVFLFITGGDANVIWEEVKDIGLPTNKIKIVEGERDGMNLLIACSDYSVFFIKPVFSKKASSPTKQAEIMAMGKPIFCNSNIGDTDFVIAKYNAGILLPDFTEEHYKNAIELSMRSHFDPKEIRRGAENFYSLSTGVEKYKRIYDLLQTKPTESDLKN